MLYLGLQMKKIVLILFCVLLFSGCATPKITTNVKIGTTYIEAVTEGIITAEQSIAAWPYISGRIKGLLAANYNMNMQPFFIQIVNKLDALAIKQELTLEEKGFVIGSFTRLEKLAFKHSWGQYWILILKSVF